MLDNFGKATKIQSDWVGRSAAEGVRTMQLFAKARDDKERWQALQNEVYAMNNEALRRLFKFQSGWATGWKEWALESSTPKKVNTASKLVSQEFNVMAQALVLLGLQTTGFVELMENINVSYGYWLKQKLAEEDNL